MRAQILMTEIVKLRHSKVTWLSWLAFSVMPLGGALFVWIAREPERASQLGLLGQKAQIAGVVASWAGYFVVLTQIAAMGGIILLAVIAAYVFGREYADNTAKVMLTLPVARHRLVLAKLIVVFGWFFALLLSVIGEGIAIGLALDLPGFSWATLRAGAGQVLFSGAIGFLLVPLVAWIATLGRGYLPPLGFTLFTLLIGNVFAVTGWGVWFPWSIIPMLAGLAGPQMAHLALGSHLVVWLTFAVGIALLMAQTLRADVAE